MKSKAALFLMGLFAVLCIMCVQPSVRAAETELPTVKVAMSDDQSIIIERILYEGLRRSGYQMVSQVTGMRTAIADVNYGDAAILSMQTDGWESDTLIKIPVVISHVEFTVYTRNGETYEISTWGDMAGLRVGYRLQNAFVANNVWRTDASKLIEVNSYEELWATLLNDEADVVILPCAERYEHRFPPGVKRLSVIERQACYTYVNSNYRHLVAPLTEAYQAMVADGMMEMIQKSEKHAADKQIILHISSYNAQVEWEHNQIEAIREKLEADLGVEYRSIDLNSNELHSQASFNTIVSNLIRADYVARYPDLIITSGIASLEFVLSNYYLLFPNVPVVFFGVQGF
ncbi:MAG: hypothetical protein FWE85_00505, partial [Clostridiales bacterium]|nr:hypothetical protein [Clostridiales bacterium]